MFIISVLMILLSGCLVGVTFAFSMVPPDKFNPLRDKIETMVHMSPELFFRTVGALMMVVAVVLLGLGFFVRRGGLVSAVLAIAVVGLIVLQQVIGFFGALTGPWDVDGLGSLVFSSLTLGLFVVLLIWLIMAARAAPKVKQARQQFQSQDWQYQQNLHGYVGYPTQPALQGYVTSNQPPALPPSAQDG